VHVHSSSVNVNAELADANTPGRTWAHKGQDRTVASLAAELCGMSLLGESTLLLSPCFLYFFPLCIFIIGFVSLMCGRLETLTPFKKLISYAYRYTHTLVNNNTLSYLFFFWG